MRKKFEVPESEKKSQDEIDGIIDAINKGNLPENIKPFLINCIRLACWFPTLLQKQHITMRKLREMIFGKGKKRKRSSDDDGQNSSSGDRGNNNGNSPTATGNRIEDNSEDSDNNAETTATEDNKKATKPKKGKTKVEIRTLFMKMPQSCGTDALIWNREVRVLRIYAPGK